MNETKFTAGTRVSVTGPRAQKSHFGITGVIERISPSEDRRISFTGRSAAYLTLDSHPGVEPVFFFLDELEVI